MPSNTNDSTPTSSKFWNIYEALVVLLFMPTAFGTNRILHLIASDPSFWMLPAILSFFVSLNLLIRTPKQPWTPFALALELTGVTVGTLIEYSISGTPFMVCAILCGPFWFLMIFLCLSVKGVGWNEMGHIGTIAGGVKQIGKFVKDIALLGMAFVKDFALLGIAALDRPRSLAGDSELGRTERDIEAMTEASNGLQANLPPPYYVSIFPDSRIFSKAVT